MKHYFSQLLLLATQSSRNVLRYTLALSKHPLEGTFLLPEDGGNKMLVFYAVISQKSYFMSHIRLLCSNLRLDVCRNASSRLFSGMKYFRVGGCQNGGQGVVAKFPQIIVTQYISSLFSLSDTDSLFPGFVSVFAIVRFDTDSKVWFTQYRQTRDIS